MKVAQSVSQKLQEELQVESVRQVACYDHFTRQQQRQLDSRASRNDLEFEEAKKFKGAFTFSREGKLVK